jgi:catechol 2,3-dioxygenase-like lactoylglutathione lyase family enzyme
MIAYTCVGTNQLEKAVAFYEALLGDIFGASIFFRTPDGVGFGVEPGKPMFAVLRPFDGKPATVGNGVMISLAASGPDQVRALHAKALALGATDEGAPGPRGDGAFFAAYFRDLDGNKLAAFCHA